MLFLNNLRMNGALNFAGAEKFVAGSQTQSLFTAAHSSLAQSQIHHLNDK
jgi:hypothetical protein